MLLSGVGRFQRLNLRSRQFESFEGIGPVDALILGIRGDEEGSRSKERIVSIRSREGSWDVASQPPELWGFYPQKLGAGCSARVHPLIDWTELDVWEYIERERIEVVSLYFDRGDGYRYRSLGCAPCSAPIPSRATTVAEIIAELSQGALSKISERAGRAQDRDDSGGLERLRRGGYM